MKILIFGGTVEGRKIAETLSGTDADVYVCVATGYGRDLLPEAENIHALAGRLTEEEMEGLLSEVRPDLVIDATHPYAVDVSKNIRAAAEAESVQCLRVKRNEADLSGADSIVIVDNTEEAVAFLEKTEGTVFLTTGSKELSVFARLTDYKERLIARVLSSAEVVQMCKDLGLPGRNIIAAQGPFGEEINYAMLKEYGASWMVTKNTGDAGGFQAKLDAAERAGVKTIVIGRPAEEADTVFTLEEVIAQLESRFGNQAEECLENRPGSETEKCSEDCHEGKATDCPEDTSPLSHSSKSFGISKAAICDMQAEESAGVRNIFLVGIGPGSKDLMTGEALSAIEESDVLIGAQRMLDACPSEKPFYKAYRTDDIVSFINTHTEYKKAAVLLSGDIGYYSGAKGLQEALSGKAEYRLKNIPGIASPIYFLDRLGKSWDDCVFTSLHGQHVNLVDRIRTNSKVVTLLGKKNEVSCLCEKLVRFGLADVKVTVGSRFSYPDEQIVEGSAAEFTGKEFDPLSVALFENHSPQDVTGGFGIPDEAFLRGKVPMTKEEIRTLSLSKLALKKDSVLYDVGAGTGSVTVAAASFCTDGCVYAIETNEEAVELIRKNAEQFGLDNVCVVPGMAPLCMEDLPAPTHVFLGGTKGNLQEIVALVRRKNPKARFVMNVITPESLSQALEFGGEIIQVQVSRGQKAGNYHLMKAENPVYIISF